MITEEYRKLNEELHKRNEKYGTSGQKHADRVLRIAHALKEGEWILDYGAGKGTLADALPMIPFKNYDPAVPEWSSAPEPAAIVTCTDVLEHIEPELLTSVLDDLQRVTKKFLYLNVATRPAKKTLADGRNAHLIVEQHKFWLTHLLDRFDIVEFTNNRNLEFDCVCAKRGLAESGGETKC